MPKIPFSTRRSGRYYFRRRVRLHDGKDIHVIVPLSTCDGQEARERAAILAAQFDRVRRTVNACFKLDHPVSLLPISHRSRTGKPRLKRS